LIAELELVEDLLDIERKAVKIGFCLLLLFGMVSGRAG
jgi:hypothetical protein